MKVPASAWSLVLGVRLQRVQEQEGKLVLLLVAEPPMAVTPQLSYLQPLAFPFLHPNFVPANRDT